MHLVLVHIGPNFPEYLNDCIGQLRSVSAIPIHVILSECHRTRLKAVDNLVIQPIEELTVDAYQQRFERDSKLNAWWRDGFWKFASQRFFYMYTYVHTKQLEDVFHIEYDNLVYYDFTRNLSAFRRKDVWLVLDAMHRCIPSFMYFRNAAALEDVLPTFLHAASANQNDMDALAQYYHTHRERVGLLPIIVDYAREIPAIFYETAPEFDSLFDGACVGQYIGGVDPRNTPGDTRGFINETTVFECDKCTVEWRVKDGMKYPYLNGRPLANLHIHSKNLALWRSSAPLE